MLGEEYDALCVEEDDGGQAGDYEFVWDEEVLSGAYGQSGYRGGGEVSGD